MSRRHIHYEAAFEDYLRSRGLPYVPVDEHRKVIFAGARVKSFDFLVYRPGGKTWLVDIKGRKFPYDIGGNRRCWENWVTREDLDGLQQWQRTFGDGFEAVLVFAYWLTDASVAPPTPYVHPFRGEYYAFMSIRAEDYQAHCRPRSASWQTLALSTRNFRRLASPVQAA
ncbi:MAG TPA: HYExAFE family protein [Phycisphaerae bacterium]|jgi:hypothetical protein